MKKAILISILSFFTFVCTFGQSPTYTVNVLSITDNSNYSGPFCLNSSVNVEYSIVYTCTATTIVNNQIFKSLISPNSGIGIMGTSVATSYTLTTGTHTIFPSSPIQCVLSPSLGLINGLYTVKVLRYVGTTLTNPPTVISPTVSINIITIPTSPTVTSNSSTTLCPSSSVQLTATGTGSLTWNPGGQTTPTISVNTANNYYVTESNQCGTSTSNTITVTQISLPIVSITGQTVACGSSTLHVNASNYTNLVWNDNQTASTITTTITDSFYAVASNTCGPVNSNTINVTINSKPTLSVSTTNSVVPLCVGQTATLTVSGADSYNWNSGFLIGDTVVVAPTSTTIYTVVGTDTVTGCSNTTTLTQNVSACTGVKNANEKSEIGKIYPIPATDVLNIELLNINDNSKMTVNIYSIQGKLVFNATYDNSDKLTFDVSNFESGMYILEVVSENYKSTKNIIVAH